MDFVKKHYEKVLLAVVLVGLAVAVVFLMIKIPSEQQELDEKRQKLLAPRVTALSNLDLALSDAALKRVAAPAAVDLGPPNRLFNPMKWQRAADQHLIRVDTGSIGPQAVQITKLTPLYLILNLSSVSTNDAGVARYRVTVEKQASNNVRERGRTEKYGGIGDKNETFKFESANGPADNPTSLILTLNDTGEKATLTKDVPFKRVDGYLADLKYPPENKTWTGRRAGSLPPLVLNNEDYKIIAINKDEVILSSPSDKKYTIKYNPASTSVTESK
jgi:hypothetical protein